jgi:hypothetical protein
MSNLPEYAPLVPSTVVRQFEQQATALRRSGVHMNVRQIDPDQPVFDMDTAEGLIDPAIVQLRFRRVRAAEHLTRFGLVSVEQERSEYTVPVDTAVTFFTSEADEGPWLRVRTKRSTADTPAFLDTEVYDPVLGQPLERHWARVPGSDDTGAWLKSGEMIQPDQRSYTPLRVMFLATQALLRVADQRLKRQQAAKTDEPPVKLTLRLDGIL